LPPPSRSRSPSSRSRSLPPSRSRSPLPPLHQYPRGVPGVIRPRRPPIPRASHTSPSPRALSTNPSRFFPCISSPRPSAPPPPVLLSSSGQALPASPPPPPLLFSRGTPATPVAPLLFSHAPAPLTNQPGGGAPFGRIDGDGIPCSPFQVTVISFANQFYSGS
jgi:hypothetical protein